MTTTPTIVIRIAMAVVDRPEDPSSGPDAPAAF